MRTSLRSKRFPTRRAAALAALRRTLAAEVELAAVTRDCQWRVAGRQSRALREIFGDQYRQLDRWIERLEERLRAIDAVLPATWSDLLAAAMMAAGAGRAADAPGMLSCLIGRHDHLLRELQREVAAWAAGDPATAEMLRLLAEFHETTAWMLGELMEDRELAPI